MPSAPAWPAPATSGAIVPVGVSAAAQPEIVYSFGPFRASAFVLGVTRFRSDRIFVELDPGLAVQPELCEAVALHELGHVVLGPGYRHLSDAKCSMYAFANPLSPTRFLCAQEIRDARARSVGDVWRVRIADATYPVVAAAIRRGMRVWNSALGRAAFVEVR